jgi:hypothetical protein
LFVTFDEYREPSREFLFDPIKLLAISELDSLLRSHVSG